VRIRLLCLALGLALRSATSPGGEHCPHGDLLQFFPQRAAKTSMNIIFYPAWRDLALKIAVNAKD
jgi:hypothetical protein